jgi:hypothetical protein
MKKEKKRKRKKKERKIEGDVGEMEKNKSATGLTVCEETTQQQQQKNQSC